MIDAVKARYKSNGHPRLILTEKDYQRIRAHRSEGVYKMICDKVIAESEVLLAKPENTYRIPDGIRLLSVSRDILHRVLTLGTAFNITGDERYAQRCYDELLAAANFPDWNPTHFLDTAELCAANALGFDMIYNWLDAEGKSTLVDSIKRHGIEAVLDDYLDRERKRTYRWYQAKPGCNWKLVCDGGVTMAVLAICDEDDDERYETVLTTAFEDAYPAVRDFFLEHNGSYFEGVNYWGYSSRYLAFMSASITSACGEDHGLTDYIGLEKTPYFVDGLCSNDAKPFNFGDAGEGNPYSSDFMWYGKRFKNYAFSQMRVRFITPQSASANDLLYYDHNEVANIEGLPSCYLGVGYDTVSMRSGRGENDMYVAVHYGDNGANHGHLDMGTFILNVGSKRFFKELGADNYNLRPYSNTYRYRAEGHNVIVVDPSKDREQLIKDARSLVSKCSESENDCYAIADITPAYAHKLERALRGVRLTGDGNAVIIRDELQTKPESHIYWYAHTSAKIELSDDGTSAVLEIDGTRLLVRSLVSGMAFSVRAAAPDENSPEVLPTLVQNIPQSVNKGVRKLVLHSTGKEETVFAVAMIKLNENGEPLANVTSEPLSEW